MLTKTQLREAKTKELERLQTHIAAELEKRRRQEAQQRQTQDKPNPNEQLFYSGHSGTYRWEWVQIGRAHV